MVILLCFIWQLFIDSLDLFLNMLLLLVILRVQVFDLGLEGSKKFVDICLFLNTSCLPSLLKI